MGIVIVIPARWRSVRFPGKPLADLRGRQGDVRTLVRRSWDAAMRVPGVDRVIVATDDVRIQGHASAFGAQVMMTSPAHRNGTERCAEVALRLGSAADLIVNLQGDAPLTPPDFVTALIAAMDAGGQRGPDMATPVLRADAQTRARICADQAAGLSGATTAVFDAGGRALYFSRMVLPHVAPGDNATDIFHHLGLYAYRPDALARYADWPLGPLERAEGLEQLRFLEQGAHVACIEVRAKGRPFWEVNNPVDIARVEHALADAGID